MAEIMRISVRYWDAMEKSRPLVKSNFSISCCIGRYTISVQSAAVIIVF